MADIRFLDVPLLRAFDALMRERGVSRAAARLHLSQPATSALLARLREVFGDPLFVRHAAGVTPTPRAEALADPVRRVLADLHALLEPAEGFDPSASDRTFHLAANDYLSATLLAPLAARLAGGAPRVRLALVPLEAATLPQRMGTGEVDAAVLVRGRAPRGLLAEPLFEERFVLAVGRQHPLARKRRLSVADVAGVPQVYVSPRDASFAGVADEMLAAHGAARFVQLSVAQFGAAIDAVENTPLAAIVPSRVARAHAHRVVAQALPFEMPGFTMEWVTHPRSRQDAGLQWLRQELLRALQALDGRRLRSSTSQPGRKRSTIAG